VKAKLHARTITLKIRLADFDTHTRSTTLRTATSDVWTIFRTAEAAYGRFRRGRRAVRLLGVSASGLVSGTATEQLTFERRAAFPEAEAAVERVRGRFGERAVRMARLLPKQEPAD
jgi:DNA polymerase-4